MRKHITTGMLCLLVFLHFVLQVRAQSAAYENLALQVSPNGTLIAMGTLSGELVLYDANTGRERQTFQHESDVIDLQWSPNGDRIAAISFYGQLSVWDTVSNMLLVSSRHLLSDGLIRVIWSPDGTQIAVTSQSGGTLVIDSLTGQELYHLQTGDTADSFWAPSPYLVTADVVGVRVWDGETEMSRTLGTVNNEINGNLPSRIAYSSSVNLIAVYGITAPTVDSVGRTTDVGQVLQTYSFPSFELLHSIELSLPPHTSVVRIKWSADGQFLAVSTTDGFIRIWSSSLNFVDEIFADAGGWAFDWLTDTEIVFAANGGYLQIVPVVSAPVVAWLK